MLLKLRLLDFHANITEGQSDAEVIQPAWKVFLCNSGMFLYDAAI